jgi:hypothetical protein
VYFFFWRYEPSIAIESGIVAHWLDGRFPYPVLLNRGIAARQRILRLSAHHQHSFRRCDRRSGHHAQPAAKCKSKAERLGARSYFPLAHPARLIPIALYAVISLLLINPPSSKPIKGGKVDRF